MRLEIPVPVRVQVEQVLRVAVHVERPQRREVVARRDSALDASPYVAAEEA